MHKRATGGVFGEIDRLLVKFEDDKKRFRAAVKARTGSARTPRTRNGLYAVRWNREWFHDPSVDALFEKLPSRGPKKEPASE